ncbi:hypothetical protein [Streptomyces sp. NPDC004629]|uniref:hypothetical protein n=1 Tax=Streptomyces sp. NPDC004629 TaxID=3364705 RepID=UPI00367E22B9
MPRNLEVRSTGDKAHDKPVPVPGAVLRVAGAIVPRHHDIGHPQPDSSPPAGYRAAPKSWVQ